MTEIRTLLLDAIYRHYPRGLWADDPAYAKSVETKALRNAQEQTRADRSLLISLMAAVEAEVPGVKAMDFSYLSYDACYIVRMNADSVEQHPRRWRELVACISIIAPVYLLYQATIEISDSGEQRTAATHLPDPDVEPLWKVAAQQIERLFSQHLIPHAVGVTVIPDVQVQNVPLGQATFYDCLFTPNRE
jgi:hypothetical protein